VAESANGATGDDVFDVQVQWDPQSQRFEYLADDNYQPAGANTNLLVFGWSKTSDPTGGWCHYALYTGTPFDDYPKLGHYDTGLVFGANTFANGTNGAFQTGHIWVVGKSANGSTTCPTNLPVSDFGSPATHLLNADGTDAFTPVPSNTSDPSGSAPVDYVVASEVTPFNQTVFNQIMVWHVSGAGTTGSPFALTQDGLVPVASYSPPANAPESTGARIDTLDARLTQAVGHTDPGVSGSPEAIWTQHTVAGPTCTSSTSSCSVVHWYEIVPSLCAAVSGVCNAAALRQGCTSSSCTATINNTNNFVFNAAISPSIAGNAAAIFFNTSCFFQPRHQPATCNQPPDIRAQSRTSTTALSTMSGETAIGGPDSWAQDFSCSPGPCRWGDYSAASPDPMGSLVWGSNQLAGPVSGSDPTWYTRNFGVTP
jgi:hypothetical protein